MLKTEKKQFWFVVGSQHLYGEEALKQVRDNGRVVAETLNKNIDSISLLIKKIGSFFMFRLNIKNSYRF